MNLEQLPSRRAPGPIFWSNRRPVSPLRAGATGGEPEGRLVVTDGKPREKTCRGRIRRLASQLGNVVMTAQPVQVREPEAVVGERDR